MGSKKVYATVAGFLALASSISTARAADLLPPPPPPPAPVEAAPDFGGGWYLRGDVGVGRYEGGKITNSVAGTTVYDRDYGSGSFAGAGIGYQFNSWFRADVTGEYRFSTGLGWRDKGDVAPAGYQTPGGISYFAPGTGYEKNKVNHSAAIVMLNGYVDLGTWYGVSPFVGAGIGWAYNRLSGGGTDTINAYGNFADASGNLLLVNGQPVRGASAASGGQILNKESGNLAWALHAGLAYDVTSNVKLELAYRYLNMGSIRTGAINCYCGEVYGGSKIKSLESHDIKLGMRWALGGPTPAPAYEPAPLMRKY